jgi:hypothetical protein
MLHVTNGDSAADRIRALGLGGEVLPWRDVLHEGPVPAPATLDSLRPLRARFLGGYGRSAVEIARDLEQRDRRLMADGQDSEVALWFEHDLYDQLQLLQILDAWAARQGPPRLILVQSDDYLGLLDAARLTALWARRVEVTDAQIEAARRAWGAFASPDPRAIEGVLDHVADLPYMRAALVRHLEEFPAIDTGLSRAERQILEALVVGSWPIAELFRAAHHDREEAMFLGDTVFHDKVQALAAGDVPLAGVEHERVWLTDAGRDALAGRRDRVETLGIDRWLGGVHLKGRRVAFRWDPRARRIAAS